MKKNLLKSLTIVGTMVMALGSTVCAAEPEKVEAIYCNVGISGIEADVEGIDFGDKEQTDIYSYLQDSTHFHTWTWENSGAYNQVEACTYNENGTVCLHCGNDVSRDYAVTISYDDGTVNYFHTNYEGLYNAMYRDYLFDDTWRKFMGITNKVDKVAVAVVQGDYVHTYVYQHNFNPQYSISSIVKGD